MKILDKFPEELVVLLVSTLPIIELRGAIPLGLSMGLSLSKVIILSLLGNMMVVPIIFILFNPIVGFLSQLWPFSKLINWVRDRTLYRSRQMIKKYSIIGLLFLVAIPLPTTGAWTASLAAMFLKLDKRKSILAIWLGLVISALIVSGISHNLFFTN